MVEEYIYRQFGDERLELACTFAVPLLPTFVQHDGKLVLASKFCVNAVTVEQIVAVVR